ncbi:MAG: two-component system sensor histidine kinase NtrB [Candidatus Saccharibacteria bacterium]
MAADSKNSTENKNAIQTKYFGLAVSDSQWMLAIVFFIICITAAHYMAMNGAMGVHEILRRLYYIPIILGAYRFGIKGGLVTSIVCGVAYAPHLMLYMGNPELTVINKLMEIGLFVIIGAITGLLAETEQKQRMQLASQLQQLREMEQEVRVADRLAATGQLAAGVAHEIRNPLGIIRAAAQLIKDEKIDNPEVNESLGVILSEVDRANGVILGLLDFARPQKPDFLRVDIIAAIREALQLASKYAAHQGIEVNSSFSDRPVFINGDRELIKQLVVNLIMNAVQASDRGRTVDLLVFEGSIEGCDGVFIEISDSGGGILDDDLERIFDPFFTTKERGTGLGLAIVHRIVRDHHGHIQVKSSPSEGTVFTVWLPLFREGEN